MRFTASLPWHSGDFSLGYMPFDPNLPALRGQLLTALGAPTTSRFEPMKGFHGGLNEGRGSKQCGEGLWIDISNHFEHSLTCFKT